jgi:3-oxoadipate enol-lactonase
MTAGLMLIHAFPLDRRMWEPQEGPLDRFRVLTPDLPGFGQAPGVGRVMSMRAAAERCLNELRSASMREAVVCGLSMGGYVALELWRMAPELITGLVLANTRSGADSDEAKAGRRALADRLLAEGNILADEPPPLLSTHADDELRLFVQQLISAQSAEAIAAAALGMAERRDSTPDLPSIHVPTLVITSDEDVLIPSEVSSAMADEIPEAELAVIKGAGHLSNLEDPDAFNEQLVSHATRCGLR